MANNNFINDNLYLSIENRSENILLFENLIRRREINNEYLDTNNSNIFVEDFDFFNKNILNELLDKSKIVNINKSNERKYRFKPKLFSFDQYNTIDYWYMILFINNFNNIYEFKGFTKLYVCDVLHIKNQVNKYIEYKKTIYEK